MDLDEGLVGVKFMKRKGGLVYCGGKEENKLFWQPITSVGREVSLTPAKASTSSRIYFTFEFVNK